MKRIIFITLLSAISILMIGQNAFKYPIIIGTNGGANGQITLNGSTSGSVVIKSNVVAGAGTVFQLPANNGTSGYLLSTDGAGVLSWIVSPVTMTYPGAGIPISTGAGWAGSLTNNSTNWDNAYTDRLKWDGGSTGLVAATGRTSLGGTTIGQAFFTMSNPASVVFFRGNADNTVTAQSATDFKTSLSLQNVTNENKATMFTNPTFTGTITLPATTSIGDVSATEIGYVNGLNGTAASRQDISDSLDLELAGAETGIALADSTGNAEGNYMTRQGTRQEISDSINLALAGAETGIALADSTGNAAGNYMTRENYLTYSSQSNLLKTLKNFGVGIKALPVGFTYVSGTYTLSENRIYTVLTYLNRGEPITGAKWYSNVAGDFVADSINAFNGVALYKCDAAGTTSTKVAVSENNANIWRAQVATIASAAFTSQYVATEGYHYIAFMYNYTEQTVAPKVYSDAGLHLTLINNLISDSKDVVGYVATQATFPDTITAADITGLTNGLPFILLY